MKRSAGSGTRSTTRLTSKGQVVIPKALRAGLRWNSGTRLDVEALPDGAIRLAPAMHDAIDAAYGCIKDGDPIGALETEHRAEIAADDRRRRR